MLWIHSLVVAPSAIFFDLDKPRKIIEPIINTRMFARLFITGLFMAAMVLYLFQIGKNTQGSSQIGQTMALVSLSMWMVQTGIVLFKSSATSNNTDRLISLKECTMKKIVVKKEEQGGTVLFTFRFKALGQLLDEGDLTPLPGKELTEEAEDALAGHLDEYRVGKSSSLVIELPEKELASVSSSLITEAVHNHFGFRYDDVTHEMKIHLREGIYSLMLLLGNVAVLLLFVYFASKNEIPMDAISITIIIGFITIMNWVTVWHTYEHFMYDYRNLARKRWIFEKITKIPVTIRGY